MAVNRDKEYKLIFIEESLQDHAQIINHLVNLEKEPENVKLLAEVFRLMHNLKANANAMNYQHIVEIAHKLENVFSKLRDQEKLLDKEVANIIFTGMDYLEEQLTNIDKKHNKKDKEKVLKELDKLFSAEKNEYKEGDQQYYTSHNIAISELISVPVKRMDDILNLVGEVVIDRDRLLSISNKIENQELTTLLSHLYRITNDLQEQVMSVRLINLGTLFSKFPRIVRDISVIEGKKVELQISGEEIKIDRNILNVITDSLLHLVRNAITHGIEDKKTRHELKKAPVGKIVIAASSEKGIVTIRVSDDGKGMDADVIRKYVVMHKLFGENRVKKMKDDELMSLIFEPGFTMAESVSKHSGRGVGLDIVKEALDIIGGNIKVNSKPGEGTRFTLTMPTSIAVKPTLLFEVGGSFFALPLLQIYNVLNVSNRKLHTLGSDFILEYEGQTIKVIYLHDFLFSKHNGTKVALENIRRERLDIIVVSYNNRKIGLIVDKLLHQQEVIIKPIQKPVDRIELFSGITLLGTGEICMLMDVRAIAKTAFA